ncbi:MAG: pyridoxal phosphate-dependent class II aminotransferase [Fretibacterium sp.]|nr:pyridoxal phosphate-dependent class II aminotransferase [Fretibacterium sp.]
MSQHNRPSASGLFRAHGANPENLYRALGLPMPASILDFSTNTNVLPWKGVLGFDLMERLSNYPDDSAEELRELIAAREGCAPENVLFVNGSNEGIYLLASFFSGKDAAVLQPVYGEYRRALTAFGALTRNVFSLSELGAGFDVVFLCNPCNPTGSYLRARGLEALARDHPQTLFVVDQAYLDFLRLEEADLEYEKVDFCSLPNLILLRSLTKIYHLCGVRIGYLLASPEWRCRLDGRRPSWSVNSVAQVAALAFLKDEEFYRRSRAFYAAETPRFIRAVEEAGFRTAPTTVHFFLMETDNDEGLILELLGRGLVVRHTRNFPGLDGSYVRVSTRLPEENDKLVEALADWKRQNSN